MGWEDLSEEERHRAESSIANARRRIKEAYGNRGFLRYYEKAEILLKKLEREFPEAKNILVRTDDVREEVLTKLLKVMYLTYGREEFANKAVEWLNEHGEYVDVEFRTGDRDEVEYEAQLYDVVAKFIVEKEIATEDYEVITGKIANPVKWGNPDVVLVKKVKGKPAEVIVAEVKNTQDIRKLFEGFGQACAYKLFSHTQYLVIPKPKDNMTFRHLQRLCSKVRIKFAVFTFEGEQRDLDHIKFEMVEGSKGEPPDPVVMYDFLEKLGMEA